MTDTRLHEALAVTPDQARDMAAPYGVHVVSATLLSGGLINRSTQVVPVTFALDKRQEIIVAHAESFATDVRLALLPPRQPDPERSLDETIYRGQDPRRHKDGTIW